MDDKLQERFEKIRKEYKKGKRKLEKLQRKHRAKAHVQQKLREQACLEGETILNCPNESVEIALESRDQCSDDKRFQATDGCQVLQDSISSTAVETFGVDDGYQNSQIPSIKSLGEKINDKVATENQTQPECISLHEKYQNKQGGNTKVLNKNLSLAKYKSRNHVVKIPVGNHNLKGLSTHFNLVNHNSNIQLDSDPVSSTLSGADDILSGLDVNDTISDKGEMKINCPRTDLDIDSPDMFDSEAIIFERKRPCDTPKIRKPFQTQKADKNRYSVEKKTNEKCQTASVEEETDKSVVNRGGIKQVVDFTKSPCINSSCSSQSSLTDSSQLTCNGGNDVVKRSLSRQKRRSLSGNRRQSPRVASLNRDKEVQIDKSSAKKTQEPIILSSMFQCLIDDVKRDEKIEDFKLTSDYFIDEENCMGEQDSTDKWKENEKCLLKKLCEPICKQCPSYLEFESKKIKAQTDKVKKIISSLDNKDTKFEQSSFVERALPGHLMENLIEEEDLTKGSIPDKYAYTPILSADTPRNEMKHSKTEPCSPTLFESPNLISDTNAEIPDCPVITQRHGDLDVSICGGDTEEKHSERPGKYKEYFDVYLHKDVSFQVPSTDVVLSLVTTEVTCTQGREIFVVCLCTQSLRFYRHVNSDADSWANVLNFALEPDVHMKKNSGGKLCAIKLEGFVGVLLQQPKSHSTTLHLYLYKDCTVKHVELDSLHGKSVCVKCLQYGGFVISYFSSPSTNLTKYTFPLCDREDASHSQIDFTNGAEHMLLEPVCGQVTCLVIVKHAELALIGITSSRKLHIWNHLDGAVLCTVDIQDVCPRDVFCPTAFSDQGYLFLPLLGRKKGREVGSVIVVNPMLSTCETLIPLEQPKPVWNGCTLASCMSGDILCVREATGQIHLWDIYNGQLLATLDKLPSNCIVSAYNHLFVFVSSNVLHVFTLKNLPETVR